MVAVPVLPMPDRIHLQTFRVAICCEKPTYVTVQPKPIIEAQHASVERARDEKCLGRELIRQAKRDCGICEQRIRSIRLGRWTGENSLSSLSKLNSREFGRKGTTSSHLYRKFLNIEDLSAEREEFEASVPLFLPSKSLFAQ